MRLVSCGINHKSAPLMVREKLTFSPEQQSLVLRDFIAIPDVAEAMVLSTCNRTELYCYTDTEHAILPWLAKYHGLPLDEIAPYYYLYREHDAVRHTMRVASGLDSMMLGEPQILGQMKRAFKLACDAGTVGRSMHDLFTHVFATTKRIRTRTEIGLHPVSIAYAGVNLVKRIFEQVDQLKVLLIGAGETVTLAARHFAAQGIKHFMVANRTTAKAQALAKPLGGMSLTIGDIPDYLAEADIVVSATACPLPFLGRGTVERALKKRKHRPIFMLDLAVPRDIEPEVAELDDVFLYNIDDLQDMVTANIRGRLDAAVNAEEIIEVELNEYIKRQKAHKANAAICDYRQQMQALADQELSRALKQLIKGDTPEMVVTQLQHRIINKLMHQPTERLRQASIAGRDDILELTEQLFV